MVHTQINENIHVWLLCPHALQGVQVPLAALSQGVAVIRVHHQGLRVLRLVLWRWQGVVGVHRAGLGVTGTGHGVAVAVLGAGARQKVASDSHPAATTDGAVVVRDAAVTSLGGVGGTESSGHVVVFRQQAGKEILSVHASQQLRRKGVGNMI